MSGGRLTQAIQHIRSLLETRAVGERADRRLLEHFAAERDELAFSALVERHGPMVLGICRRVLGDIHEAEDAFQATFLMLSRKAGALDRRSSVAGWLAGGASSVQLTGEKGTTLLEVFLRSEIGFRYESPAPPKENAK
jgi:Sigma-70 region 2